MTVGCDREKEVGNPTPDFPAILLAEDLESDALLMQRAFNKAQILNPLQVVSTGNQVISYLKAHGPHGEVPLPGLLLLNLTLPDLDGFGVLKWLQAEPTLMGLPVVVVSSSGSPADLARAYTLGANGYMLKPCRFDALVSVTQALYGFWFGASQPESITRAGLLLNRSRRSAVLP
jgi:DNA-binding response OmpR family regulator